MFGQPLNFQNTDNQPFISVIIPVFNDSDKLKNCLNSLHSQTYDAAKYEIIVVDNDSSENTAEITNLFSSVKLISEKQKGSYAARNKGIRESGGEILAFTDADCLPNNDWLEKGSKKLIETSNCGLVGGKITLFFADVNEPTIAEIYESLTYFDQKHFVENLHFSATANLFTFRKIFDEVGLFSNDLLSGGDFEWGQRVWEKGHKLIYDEESQIKHPARRTVQEVLHRSRRIRGGAWHLQKRGIKWVNRHELNLFGGLIPPLKRSAKLWQRNELRGFWQKLKIVGLENLLHYSGWLEIVRLRLGGRSIR